MTERALNFYEEIAAEVATMKKQPILFMGRLEVQLNEIFKKECPYHEAMVYPSDPCSTGWIYFVVKVGDNHGNHVCDFQFEFPQPNKNIQWERCAKRTQRVVLAAVKAI